MSPIRRLGRSVTKTLKLVGMLVTPPLIFFMVVGFINYQQATKDLPPLNSEFDVHNALKGTIEGERRNLRRLAGTIHDDVSWGRPSLLSYPSDFVTIYLAVRRCPTFFRTRRESNSAWAWRVFMKEVLKRNTSGRDGQCELAFAQEVAAHLQVKKGTAANIAAYRLRLVMTRDQLVAYDLAAMPIEPGYFGAHDASRLLLKKELDQLSLAEQVELSVALPPFNRYEEVRDCRQLIDVKYTRNDLLDSLAAAKLIPEERARAAKGEPLTCAHR